MTLAQRDQKHLWHPLTQHKLSKEALAIKKAKGVYLYDEEGNKYIDAIASWYTCMYGHCNDYVLDKIKAQMSTLDQVVFAGFTHEPAVELSEKLIEILPNNQEKIFFSDNGSTTVDIAIKMCLQYYFNQGEKRLKIVAFENAFHGDTFGAMSVSGLSVYNGPFDDVVLSVDRIAVPNDENYKEVLTSLEELLKTNEVACFVFEPLVQGANCMHMYKAEYLDALLALCKQYNVLTVADEVMTGFGKTGTYFASDQLENKPEIMCLSKALTAGFVPMGLTTCSKKVYDAFYDNNIAKGFFHGHTYSANPIACTAAIASIELIQSDFIQSQIAMIKKSHKEFAEVLIKHDKVKQVRTTGVILALDLKEEIERYGKDRNSIFKFFMNKGVFLRPLGNTIYLLPPYVIGENELKTLYTQIECFLNS